MSIFFELYRSVAVGCSAMSQCMH